MLWCDRHRRQLPNALLLIDLSKISDLSRIDYMDLLRLLRLFGALACVYQQVTQSNLLAFYDLTRLVCLLHLELNFLWLGLLLLLLDVAVVGVHADAS